MPVANPLTAPVTHRYKTRGQKEKERRESRVHAVAFSFSFLFSKMKSNEKSRNSFPPPKTGKRGAPPTRKTFHLTSVESFIFFFFVSFTFFSDAFFPCFVLFCFLQSVETETVESKSNDIQLEKKKEREKRKQPPPPKMGRKGGAQSSHFATVRHFPFLKDEEEKDEITND